MKKLLCFIFLFGVLSLQAQKEYKVIQSKSEKGTKLVSSIPTNKFEIEKSEYLTLSNLIKETLNSSTIWFEELEVNSDELMYIGFSDVNAIHSGKINFRMVINLSPSEVRITVDNHYIRTGAYDMSVEDFCTQYGFSPSMIYYDLHKRISYYIIPKISSHIKNLSYERNN